jgi:betaine lipid synthase
MASLTPNTLFVLPQDPHSQIIIVGASVVLLVGIIFAATFRATSGSPKDGEHVSTWSAFLRFVYACFLKPHESDGSNGQQDALESFYKAQAGVYDKTRKQLLRGREDMLGLVAAQLVAKAARERTHDPKRIWVDVSTHW